MSLPIIRKKSASSKVLIMLNLVFCWLPMSKKLLRVELL